MPYALAYIKGNYLAPNLDGKVEFYEKQDGTLVKIEIANLPQMVPATKDSRPIGPFAFHIHEGTTCGNESLKKNTFEEAEGHLNLNDQPHPFHTGDLPSLFANDGYAYMEVYTNRFKPQDVINRTVIIHQSPDDYESQPSGNAGKRIACGIIKRVT